MLKTALSRSMGMHAAPQRIPMIKFRYGSRNGVASHPEVKILPTQISSPTQNIPVPRGASVPITIMETETPVRFMRRDIDDDEIDYINRGGPA